MKRIIQTLLRSISDFTEKGGELNEAETDFLHGDGVGYDDCLF